MSLHVILFTYLSIVYCRICAESTICENRKIVHVATVVYSYMYIMFNHDHYYIVLYISKTQRHSLTYLPRFTVTHWLTYEKRGRTKRWIAPVIVNALKVFKQSDSTNTRRRRFSEPVTIPVINKMHDQPALLVSWNEHTQTAVLKEYTIEGAVLNEYKPQATV